MATEDPTPRPASEALPPEGNPGEAEAAAGAPSPELVRLLVDNHRQFLAFLERRVGNRATAEDILQEAFVRGVSKLSTVADEGSVVAWFYRVLRNAVIDHHRRRQAQSKSLDALAHAIEDRSDPDLDTKDAICRCVASLARTLKPEYAEVLTAVDIEEIPVKEFAARAGISASNAGVRLYRAREALRRQVGRSCGTCAEHGCLDCTCESVCGNPGAEAR